MTTLKQTKLSTQLLISSDITPIEQDIDILSNDLMLIQTNSKNINNIIDDKYVTKFEVFPTLTTIPAGSPSDVSVDFYAMFNGLKTPGSSNIYDLNQIAVNTSAHKIYKSLSDANSVNFADTTKWQDITNQYFSVINGVTYHNYINGVSVETKQSITLRSSHDISQQNVIIDWGDDTKTIIGDSLNNTDVKISYSKQNEDYEITYICTHDYADYLQKIGVSNKKITVTITGTTYWSIRLNDGNKNNIVSRIWDLDLPFYDGCTNIASFVTTSDRLLYVRVPAYYSLLFTLYNGSSAFAKCTNLQYVHGFNKYVWYQSIRSIDNIFSGCSNLIKSDCRIPRSFTYTPSAIKMYADCSNLAVDLNSLLPGTGFETRRMTGLSSVFLNCISLTCSDTNKMSDMLWNDDAIKWSDQPLWLLGCNSTLSNDVPINWGGSKA